MFLSNHLHVLLFVFPSFMKNIGMLFMNVLFYRKKRLANLTDNLQKRKIRWKYSIEKLCFFAILAVLVHAWIFSGYSFVIGLNRIWKLCDGSQEARRYSLAFPGDIAFRAC